MPLNSETSRLQYVTFYTAGVGYDRTYTLWIGRHNPQTWSTRHARYALTQSSLDRLVRVVNNLVRKGLLTVKVDALGWTAHRPKEKEEADRVSNWWVIWDDAADTPQLRMYSVMDQEQLLDVLIEPESPNRELVIEHPLPEDSGVLLTVQGELFIWCIRMGGYV